MPATDMHSFDEPGNKRCNCAAPTLLKKHLRCTRMTKKYKDVYIIYNPHNSR